jgi:hypothetical protein
MYRQRFDHSHSLFKILNLSKSIYSHSLVITSLIAHLEFITYMYILTGTLEESVQAKDYKEGTESLD